MNSAMSLTIDQILLAARVLEQQKQAALIDPMTFLGQNYENRTMQTKMRGIDIPTTTATLGLPNSTGSSLRSSPYCSQNSSSPNSPQNGQLLMSNLRENAKLSSASSVAPLLTGRSSNAATSSSILAPVSHSTRQSRAAHNELEKNRRANLRSYLDNLKAVLPADQESTRDTTLSLLTRARNYIRLVKRQKQSLLVVKQEALNENARLKARLEELKQNPSVQPNQQIEEVVEEIQECQQIQQEPIASQPMQIADLQSLQSLQLARPEPQHVEQQSPLYMEFSPSAKPSTASQLDNSTLSALLSLNALQTALNQATSQMNPIVSTPLISSLDSTAAFLNAALSVTSNNLGFGQSTNLLCAPFRNIDLINEGLLPTLPLLYPYNSNAC